MLKNYNLKMPGVVYSGESALIELQKIIEENTVKKIALFTDKSIRKTGLLELPLKQIYQSGADVEILDDLPAEPTYMQAQALIEAFRATGAELIVAVGGGSVMDTAKLSSILATDDYIIKDLLDDPTRGRKYVKTVMIPTTAGTGAEATPNAIVAVPEKELKVGIVNDEMIADYVILDAQMIKYLPRNIAASTGVDALCHAIECWTSNKANPFSDLFAIQALDLILNNIVTACNDPDAMDAKNKMQLASFYAGVAITASGTTAVHALSYPLGGKYHIAHGVSNAILLTPVMRFNELVCRDRFAMAYDYCVHEEAQCTTPEEKSRFLLEWMENIVRKLDIPVNLKEFNVPAQDLDALVEAGMQVQRLLVNNMRQVISADARAIYQSLL